MTIDFLDKFSNNSFNFIKHKNYNVDKIKSIVETFDQEWRINVERQTRNDTHGNTLSYFAYETDLHWRKGQPYVVDQKSFNQDLIDALEPIILDLEKTHNGKRGQVLIIKLLSGSIIKKHKDSGQYLMSARRHHIPLITSDNTVFGVGDEEINMAVGDCWEINNSKIHYVNNYSEVDRIHLLVDILPVRELG